MLSCWPPQLNAHWMGRSTHLNSLWLLNLPLLNSRSIQGLGDKALVRKQERRQGRGPWRWASTPQTRALRPGAAVTGRQCRLTAGPAPDGLLRTALPVGRGAGAHTRSFVLIALLGGKVGLLKVDINVRRSWINCQWFGLRKNFFFFFLLREMYKTT